MAAATRAVNPNSSINNNQYRRTRRGGTGASMGGSQGGDLPCWVDTCDSSPPIWRANSRVDRTRRAYYTKAPTVAKTLTGSAIRRPRWDATPPGPLLCGTHLWHHLLALPCPAPRPFRSCSDRDSLIQARLTHHVNESGQKNHYRGSSSC